MPLLYGIIIVCFIVWFVGGTISSTLKEQREEATGGKRFRNEEGKSLAGFYCELVGEEFEKAKQIIMNNINEYDAGLFQLLEKYDRQLLSKMTISLDCSSHGGFTSKKDIQRYKQCEKEFDVLIEKFNSKPFPVLRKYDNKETFGQVGWNIRHPWLKVVHAKYALGCNPYNWSTY